LSVNTLPPPTGTSDAGPRTAPPPAGALDEGAPDDGASEEGAVLVPGAEFPADGEPPASSLPPQAASSGAPAPASATIAAQRSTVLRSRTSPSAAMAVVSSLMNVDLQSPFVE
jgi:hypothetical protein